MSKKGIPAVILRQSVFTGGFALICAVTGIATGCSGDKSLMSLSLLVAGGCLYRVVANCMAARNGRLLVLEGSCTGVSAAFRRFKEITLEDEEGNEHKLRLQKSVRIKPGEKYRFYFRDTGASRVGIEYVDTLLSVGNYLGVEDWHSKSDLD